jgi:hypothetical protein
MRFTGAIVTAIAAASTSINVSAFGVQSNLAVPRSSVGPSASALLMSLNDLESKLLTTPESPSKQSKTSRKMKAAPPAQVPVPAPASEPVVAEKKQKGSKKYVDLGDVPPPKAKAPAPKPAPKPQPAPRAPPALVKEQERPDRVKVVPPPPKAQPVAIKSAVKDPNAGPVGVALGAAPLLLAPFVALTAARGALGKTAARREQIQEEIAEKKRAAEAKAAADTSVDAGGVVGALVSVEYAPSEEFGLVWFRSIEIVIDCFEKIFHG